MELSESFYEPLVIKRPLWKSFSIAVPVQALRGLPCLGSSSVVWCVRHIERPPWLGSYSVDWLQALKGAPWEGFYSSSEHQSLKGAEWVGSCSVVQWVGCIWWASLSVVQLLMLACWEREGWWLPPPRMTQQYRLASMAAWLSLTGISYHSLLPHLPLIGLSAVHNSPCLGLLHNL